MADPVVKAAKNILDAQLFGVMSSVAPAVEYESSPSGMRIKTPVPTVKLRRHVDTHDNIIGVCTTAGNQLTFLAKHGRAGVPDAVPLDVDGRSVEIPVAVVECGDVTLVAELTARIRPIQGGYSIGNRRFESAGTLGAWVQIGNEHNEHTGWIGLSNNHVFAGYDREGQIDDDILQPGVLDDGNEVIGRLSYIHPISVDGTNVIDFAYCTPLFLDAITPEIHTAGSVRGVTEPDIDMAVEKIGRTTGHTTGRILSLNATIGVQDPSTGKAVTFTRQIMTNCEIRHGDSGSILLEQGTGMMVGLCFARGDLSFANHVAFLFEIPNLPPEALVDITGGLQGLSPLLQLQPSSEGRLMKTVKCPKCRKRTVLPATTCTRCGTDLNRAIKAQSLQTKIDRIRQACELDWLQQPNVVSVATRRDNAGVYYIAVGVEKLEEPVDVPEAIDSVPVRIELVGRIHFAE